MGYIGYSRSERSAYAIENYEVPKSLIKRDLILNYLESDNFKEFLEEKNIERKKIEKIINELKNRPLKDWKNVTKLINPSSWHHTGKFYNKTDHYSLNDIAEFLMNNKSIELEKNKEKINFIIIEKEIWGGTRKYPKFLGTENIVGVQKDNWLLYKIFNNINKIKLDGNTIRKKWEFDKWEDLTKKFPEYNSYKNKIFSIITEKNLAQDQAKGWGARASQKSGLGHGK